MRGRYQSGGREGPLESLTESHWLKQEKKLYEAGRTSSRFRTITREMEKSQCKGKNYLHSYQPVWSSLVEYTGHFVEIPENQQAHRSHPMRSRDKIALE